MLLFPLREHFELLQVCLHREVVNNIFLFQVERDINKLFAAKGSEHGNSNFKPRSFLQKNLTFFLETSKEELFVRVLRILNKNEKIGKQACKEFVIQTDSSFCALSLEC